MGALVIMTWTGVLTAILFGMMRIFGILRVSQEIEAKGKYIEGNILSGVRLLTKWWTSLTVTRQICTHTLTYTLRLIT